ncbi:fumarylacetoacetate hydrolase family protein [Pseudotabrizicola sp. L79]|uniref:fumarylacetoacetate hydrolase family protein n=1 Tax=Pseudotabrizicola sp. L79 TaxID=3118402 RepID=UPI002F92A4BF
MKLVTFSKDGQNHAGVLTETGIVPAAAMGGDIPNDVVGIIAGGAPVMEKIRKAMANGAPSKAIAASEVRMLAPIPVPARNIFCVGKNYVEHAKEFQGSGFDSSSAGQSIPDVPIVFTKAPSSVIGPNMAVESSLDPTGTLDYEGELAVIIGTGGRGIKAADAMNHVFGYSIVNDVTARETQNRHKQWFLGKSPDTFCPMGPAILTADAVPDVHAMTLKTWVNGELRQDAVVRDLIFDIPTIIETISAAITLQPGDIIATGTPVGVAVGFKPPKYMKAGDTVAVEIAGIGKLENPIN